MPQLQGPIGGKGCLLKQLRVCGPRVICMELPHLRSTRYLRSKDGLLATAPFGAGHEVDSRQRRQPCKNAVLLSKSCTMYCLPHFRMPAAQCSDQAVFSTLPACSPTLQTATKPMYVAQHADACSMPRTLCCLFECRIGPNKVRGALTWCRMPGRVARNFM